MERANNKMLQINGCTFCGIKRGQRARGSAHESLYADGEPAAADSVTQNGTLTRGAQRAMTFAAGQRVCDHLIMLFWLVSDVLNGVKTAMF